LLAVRDVEASSGWYQRLLGATSGHGGPDYERLLAPNGPIGDSDALPYGNGVLLWFEVDDFDDAVRRAVELGAEVLLPERRNPPEGQPGGPAHRELWIRDLDGYAVVIASPDGEAA
jgi:predicted enzyme related to lactoylglutathione lyase